MQSGIAASKAAFHMLLHSMPVQPVPTGIGECRSQEMSKSMNKQTNCGTNKQTNKHTHDASRGPDKAKKVYLVRVYIEIYTNVFMFMFIIMDTEKKGYLLSSGTKDMIKGENAVLAHRHPAPALLCTPSHQSVV